MATPNYSYEKRQRELVKKRKAEEKRQRKTSPGGDGGSYDGDQAGAPDNGATPAGDDSSPAPVTP